MSGPTDTGRRAEMLRLIRGFQVSRMLGLVATLGVADRIEPDSTIRVDDLAAACAVQPDPLLRVLRALAAFGIFRVAGDGIVAHSPYSLLLRQDASGSLHRAARFHAARGSWRAWGELDAALTGGVPYERAWGMSRFDYLREHADEARLFDAHMAHAPDDRHDALAGACDVSRAGVIVDVGGGNGETLRAILRRVPSARGIVVDRADVVAGIPADARLDGRLEARAGDFFTELPRGADVYLLVRVLHDWSDDDGVRILSTCRRAMAPHARLLIGEQILDPDPASGPPDGYLTDVHMMAMFGRARERTESELRGLLDRAGFAVVRVIPTPSVVSIVEAAPRELRP